MSREFFNFVLVGIVLMISLNFYQPKQSVSLSLSPNTIQVGAGIPPYDSSASTDQSNPQDSDQSSYKPRKGYVSDEQTAIAIAVAVWTPIYGKRHIERERPYRAGLKNGVWTVTGSLPRGSVGGVATAEISQDSGCILRVIHYR